MSENHRSIEDLKTSLLKSYKRLENRKFVQIYLNALIILSIWLIAFVLIEQKAFLSVAFKSSTIIGLLLLVGFIISTGLKKIKKIKFIHFYRAFSQSSNLKELEYALDLEKNTIANPKLVEAAIYKNLELVNPDHFNTQLDYFYTSNSIIRSVRKKWVLFFILIVSGSLTALNFKNATYRYFTFFENYEKPNPFNFTVLPGNTTFEQGTPFVVSIQFKNDLIPNEVSLYLKTPIEENFRKRGMDIAADVFSSSSIELNSDIIYYLEMDGFKSEVYTINVELRPRLIHFSVAVISPFYTLLDTIYYEYPFSLVQGIQGSNMVLRGIANKKLGSFLIKNRTSEQNISINEHLEFETTRPIISPDTIQFLMKDETGLSNANTFQFFVDAIIDDYPYAEIIEPKSSYEEIEPKQVEILYRTSDDFNITNTSFVYELRRAFVDDVLSKKISFDITKNGILQRYKFELEKFELKPKDELTFWIETSDNDTFNGNKTSKSKPIILTVPSLIDYFNDLEDEEKEVQSDLDQISESFEEMQQQYEMFEQQMREDPEIDYQDIRQLEEVKKQQKQIKEQIDDLNKKFDEIKEELKESDLLSEETLKAYDKLQQLMEEIDDPTFKEALLKLQENMQNMTPEQLREAMENTQFNEQLYKERLERTIELFKKLKLNTELERLAQSYEDLARQEEESNIGHSSKNEKQQESLLEQTKQLEEQLNNLHEKTTAKEKSIIDQLQKQSKDKLDKIKEELTKRLDKMKESKSNRNENVTPQSEDSGERGDQDSNNNSQDSEPTQLNKQYKELAQLTRNVMFKMNQKSMNVNITGIQYILYSLINLSLEQEDLAMYAADTEDRSHAYIELARDQKNIENNFYFLSDSLFQLSKEIPAFSNQINKEKLKVEQLLEQSLVQMAERNQKRASIATRQALGGINKITYSIAELIDQLQNQNNKNGSGSGMSMQQMIEQMQQMGQNQQQINQQIQDMINDIQGDRLSNDQMERLNQLSKQQNAIRKQLQQIQQNGGSGGDEIGSKLERMIEQMEETINDLRGGAVDPTLINRQQTILSRMLEAEKAIQERDEEERREGESGKDFERVSPPDITLEELEKQIQMRLNDPNFTKYSPDYQQLIERYFELLKEMEKKKINN